jgi:hypothetical protein
MALRRRRSPDDDGAMGGVLRRFWYSLLGTIVVVIVFLAGVTGGAFLFIYLGRQAYFHHWLSPAVLGVLGSVGELMAVIAAAIAVRVAMYSVPRSLYRRRLPMLRSSRPRVTARINKVVPLQGVTYAGFQDAAQAVVRCRLVLAWRDPETGAVRGCRRHYRFRTESEAAEFMRAYPQDKEIGALLKPGHPSMTIPDTPYAPRWREMW